MAAVVRIVFEPRREDPRDAPGEARQQEADPSESGDGPRGAAGFVSRTAGAVFMSVPGAERAVIDTSDRGKSCEVLPQLIINLCGVGALDASSRALRSDGAHFWCFAMEKS